MSNHSLNTSDLTSCLIHHDMGRMFLGGCRVWFPPDSNKFVCDGNIKHQPSDKWIFLGYLMFQPCLSKHITSVVNIVILRNLLTLHSSERQLLLRNSYPIHIWACKEQGWRITRQGMWRSEFRQSLTSFVFHAFVKSAHNRAVLTGLACNSFVGHSCINHAHYSPSIVWKFSQGRHFIKIWIYRANNFKLCL